MSAVGNIIWFVFGGFILSCMYLCAGLLMCFTIIGIPFGVQLIRIAGLSLLPFGRDVEIMEDGGCLSLGFNILWIVFGWWEIAILHLILAAFFAITIIGIPFAKAHFRLMKLSFFPFGSTIK